MILLLIFGGHATTAEPPQRAGAGPGPPSPLSGLGLFLETPASPWPARRCRSLDKIPELHKATPTRRAASGLAPIHASGAGSGLAAAMQLERIAGDMPDRRLAAVIQPRPHIFRRPG